MKILVTEQQLGFIVKEFKNNIINESYENNTMVIGDSIGYYLSQKLNLPNNFFLNSTPEQIYTTKDLLNDLIEEDKPKNEIKNLIISIGFEDLFYEKSYIENLCNVIYELFPNANYYVIEGFLPSEIVKELDENKKIDLEFARASYYDSFPDDIFTIIDSGELISREELNINSSKINFILNQLLRFLNLGTDEIELQDKEISKNKKEILGKEIKFIDLNLDDRKDYDEIEEILFNLMLMIKSNNIYDKKMKNTNQGDIEIIQIGLKLLELPYSDQIEINGELDNVTEKVVKNYQNEKGLDEHGVVDSKFLEKLFKDIESKNFTNVDVLYILDRELFDKNQNELLNQNNQYLMTNGRVQINSLGGEKESNANLMIDYMNEKGITNPYTQIGILSVIGKESGFVPQNEICYDSTSNSRIREIFGSCRLGKYDDKGLTVLKKDCVKFFDAVYGKDASPCFRFNTGNDQVGDGYKYRGRGFNGITFKTIYKQIGDYIGEDLVSDPEKLNNLDVAAKAAVAYFTKGKDGSSLPEFDNETDAINYFVDLNAGGNAMSETRQNAFNVSGNFEVVEK